MATEPSDKIMLSGKWIVPSGSDGQENERYIYRAVFAAPSFYEQAYLVLTASTRYTAYLNGVEIAGGPARSGQNIQYYDRISLGGILRTGNNELIIRVWSYGWSTYQSLPLPGGLCFHVELDGRIVLVSDENVESMIDTGYIRYAPKRNVNLGFTDYYDARAFKICWQKSIEGKAPFENAKQRPGRQFHSEVKYPRQIVAVWEADRGCQQISLNARRAFFGDRKDADETIFSGIIGCELTAPVDLTGTVSFPNRCWNGLMGDLVIDGCQYAVSNEKRRIKVSLSAGRHLFLILVSGKYDDLYCHLEFDFERELLFSEFFTVGPTQRIIPVIDGRERVYGGLIEFNRMESETRAQKLLAGCKDIKALKICAEEQQVLFSEIDRRDVFEDMYLLSLAMTDKALPGREGEATLSADDCNGLLWNNDKIAVITPPEKGEFKNILVDFGDIYAGSFSFTLKAKAGLVIDIYCFENLHEGRIDFTTGLNNGLRYICCDGWQHYRGMARIGVRYALLTFRNQTGSVMIRDFHMHHATYSLSGRGTFASSDPLLTSIWDMCKKTLRLCAEDSYVDCPTWEQVSWLGDAQLTALVNACCEGDYELTRHNIVLAAGAMDNTPLMNALTPTDWNTSIPLESMNWYISIAQYMEITGDVSVLDEVYTAMTGMLDYYGSFITNEGAFLINAWNMVDWTRMDIHNYGVVTGQQAALAYCYQLGSAFAKERKEVARSRQYGQWGNLLRTYIENQLWDEEKQCFADGWSPQEGLSSTAGIQTQALVYLYGCVTDIEKKAKTEQNLVHPKEQIEPAGSPYMLYYVHRCLRRLHADEMVLADIRRRWGEMLRYNSTTCWEVFPGFYENSRTRSYCHAWSATPAIFLQEEILGVKRTAPGFRSVLLQVRPFAGQWCRGSVPTPFGTIHVWWDAEKKSYRAWIPEGIFIETDLPEGWKLEIER